MSTKSKRTIKQQIAILTEVQTILERLKDHADEQQSNIKANEAEIADAQRELFQLEPEDGNTEDLDEDTRRKIRDLKSTIRWDTQYIEQYKEQFDALQELSRIIEEAVN